MRSVVAEKLRAEDLKRVAEMTSEERVLLALELGDQVVADYARNHALSLDEARHILRQISAKARRERRGRARAHKSP